MNDPSAVQTGAIALAIILGALLMLVGKKHTGGNLIFWAVVITFVAPFLFPVATQYAEGVPVFGWPILAIVLILLMVQAIVILIFGRRVGDPVTAGLIGSIGRALAVPRIKIFQVIGRLLQRFSS